MWLASVRIFMYTNQLSVRPLLFTWSLAYIRALAIALLPLALTILSYGKTLLSKIHCREITRNRLLIHQTSCKNVQRFMWSKNSKSQKSKAILFHLLV